MIALPKPGKDPQFPPNLRPISLLSTAGKLFTKVILEIIQRHIEGRNFLNANQFGLCEYHSMTRQCMSLTGPVTLNLTTKRLQLGYT
jgi:hypothetical protein